MRQKRAMVCLLVLVLALSVSPGLAQPPPGVGAGEAHIEEIVAGAFSYQGLLTEDDEPVTGSRDMVFRLYSDDVCSSQVGSDIDLPGVQVIDGFFSVEVAVDHGDFDGQRLWLGVEVEGTAIACQEILAVPYALGLRPGSEVNATHEALTLNSLAGRALTVGIAGEEGVRVDQAAGTGVHVDLTGGNGLYVGSAGVNGLHISSAAYDGIYVSSAGSNGLTVLGAGHYGVYANGGSDPEDYGGRFYGANGVYGRSSNGYGGHFFSESDDALYVETGWTSGARGVSGVDAAQNAISVASAPGHGLYIGPTGSNSISVADAGANGLSVQSADYSGVKVLAAGDHGVDAQGGPDADDYGGHFTGYHGVYGQGTGAGGYGGYFSSSSGDGIYVGPGAVNGVVVDSAVNDAVNVGTAQTGLHVESASWFGVLVGDAGYDGVLVVDAGQDGVEVTSADEDGLRVMSAGMDGVHISSANQDALFANTADEYGEWGLNTPDWVQAAGYATVGSLALVARNGGDTALEPGDVVTAAGLDAPLSGTRSPVTVVRQADARRGGAAAGIVSRRFVIEQVTDEGAGDGAPEPASYWRMHSTEGAAAPGEYLLLVLLGPCQVKVDTSGGAIRPGDMLAMSTHRGRATRAQSLTVQGVTFYPPGTTIGTALSGLEDESGLVWVLVDVH